MPDNAKDKIQTIRYAPPPAGVPVYGRVPPRSTSFLGRANYTTALQTRNFIFGIDRRDRLRHMYVVGKSGSGKSKFLELLMRQDIAYGYGLCFIDSYDEVIDALLDFVPEERVSDVLYLNLGDIDFPISINPFFKVSEKFKHQYVEFLVEVFRGYCGDVWTSEAEYVSRFIFLALLDYQDASFFGILSMLTNSAYRARVLKDVRDPVVLSFWTKEFKDKQKIFDERVILPFKTKFGHFFFDPVLRNIFSQTKNSIDFAQAIRSKKIVFVKLSKEMVSDDAIAFLGGLFMAFIRISAAEVSTEDDSPKQFYLYIDEFQNIQMQSFPRLFSELARFGVSITLANRYIGQMSDSVRSGIFGNVGNIVVFRVSGEDAAKLRLEMSPTFDAKDMINLSTREFYIKMVIRDETSDPFSGEVLKVHPHSNSSFRGGIISNSRNILAAPKTEAEKMFEVELKNYLGKQNLEKP